MALGLKSIYKQIFPINYSEIVLKYCEQYDVEPHVVFAVIKNESGFKKDAVSIGVGARGLMQITEETFIWLKAKENEKTSYTFEDLFEPDVNIRYGVFLLSLAKEEFSSVEAVLASYHAGFNATKKWLKDRNYSLDGINLSSTPFKDTNLYIKNVKKSIEIYKKIYGGKYGK
jgi:soluble lytic murein transglycosylase